MKSHRKNPILVTVMLLFLTGCSGDELPADFAPPGDCILVTPVPLHTTEEDPHEGTKEVFYCGQEEEELWGAKGPVFPIPAGTRVLKISTREDQGYPWLVAEAVKDSDGWKWNEWTRNFPDESYAPIPVDESVCTDCHKDAKESDWMFTVFVPPGGL